MHTQRILFAGASLAMAPTLLFSWVAEAVAQGEVAHRGYEFSVVKTACALAVVLLVSLLGKRDQRVTWVFWIVTLGTGLYGLGVAVFFYAWFTFKMIPHHEQQLHAEMFWPGYGCFVMLTASLVLIVVCLFSPLLFREAKRTTRISRPTPQPAA